MTLYLQYIKVSIFWGGMYLYIFLGGIFTGYIFRSMAAHPRHKYLELQIPDAAELRTVFIRIKNTFVNF